MLLMRTSFLLFLFVIALLGASCQNGDNGLDHPASLNYLALGDSYTIGQGIEAEGSFPNQLQMRLTDKGFQINAPKIIARTGWTTDELSAAIANADVDSTYQFVSLLIGVNNQFRGRDIENYALEFEALLKKSIHFASGEAGRVVVLSIPDWGVTPFAQGRDREQIAREIDAFNQRKKQIADQYGVVYVDVTAISRMAAGNSALLANDGLHPSVEMYGLWVDDLFPVVMQIIESQ